MADPYLGEIRPVAFNFAPSGWAMCNGATLAISDNTALFSLLGTSYGGNGTSTFQIPNLNGRVAVCMGTGTTGTVNLGDVAGVETVTLTAAQLPAHGHTINAVSASGNASSPLGAYIAASTENQFASVASATGSLATAAITASGSSQPHSNLQPYLTMNYIIAITGIYPSRS